MADFPKLPEEKKPKVVPQAEIDYDIKDWVKEHYSGEIENLIEISKDTGREAITGFCAHTTKEKAEGSAPFYTPIIVEAKDLSAGPMVKKPKCRRKPPVGTVHTHPRANNRNVRLSVWDRKNAKKNEDLTCVASPGGKVVCEDFRGGKGDKFSFMVGGG